ncbi:protein-tyrosine-phosphatase [Sphingobacterium allocomposti]|uniref:Protein-tyrosine-phosphatase n=1 Tax=Sphingobacterium allocomposti TaxID=415956 RepID=A0A5S5DC27_9SPHI|nr:protein-tyrosine-phosphatase [Sphingobacterium composti Yoo et al. 2007 non Ten et al. 2007]TYP92262.1 protein-tyrosine-phosphatase [Sphingobacterium composti Yoo et al. 2007 non Ten et al. 2007]
MNPQLLKTIQGIVETVSVSNERQTVLQPLIDYVQERVARREPVSLTFICTHNSRRSHFSQVWAQCAAAYFNIPEVYCYSGGTEETALFPAVAETLLAHGFHVFNISHGQNPVYAIKYDVNAQPLIGFSKTYDSPFNPSSAFAAVMTCSQADSGCPFIAGADRRIPLTFEDPKVSDGTPDQGRVYTERSIQIAAEMLFVFSKVNLI